MIPKIIHYCWFGGKEKPEDVKRYLESWRKYCPGYEIREWNESNFDINENDYCREAYEAKKWAFVTDYVRLAVLYRYGGFYMDTDVEVVKPLEPLRVYDAVSGYESETHIPTGTIGACRDNDWIGMLLKDYDHRHFLKKDGTLNLTTNVIFITRRTVQKYHLQLDGTRKTFGNNMVLLPFDYLCAKDLATGEVKRTSHTYTIHHFAGSWVAEDQKRYEELRRKYNKAYQAFGLPTRLAAVLAKVQATRRLYGWGRVAGKSFRALRKKRKEV